MKVLFLDTQENLKKASNNASLCSEVIESKKMNKAIVIIGISLCLSGIILFALVLSQPPTENPVRRNSNELSDNLYLTSFLPIFILSSGIWMIAVGIRR
jgi:hypothetical protein